MVIVRNLAGAKLGSALAWLRLSKNKIEEKKLTLFGVWLRGEGTQGILIFLISSCWVKLSC
jgi:hypothetical protein